MQPLGGGLDTADRLHVIDASGEGPLWAPVGNITRYSAVGALTDAGERLRNYCAEYPPRLLVVDNLAAAFACNENDRAMVRAFMTSWDGWARETKCAVMKEYGRGGQLEPKSTPTQPGDRYIGGRCFASDSDPPTRASTGARSV